MLNLLYNNRKAKWILMRYIAIFLLIFKLFASAPYSNSNFKDILDKSKLQAPTSSYNPRYSVHYGKFKGYYNKYFYLSNYKYMTFKMCGKKRRSELRLKDEWQVSDKNSHILIAKVKALPQNVDEFTILQIHKKAITDLTHLFKIKTFIDCQVSQSS